MILTGYSLFQNDLRAECVPRTAHRVARLWEAIPPERREELLRRYGYVSII